MGNVEQVSLHKDIQEYFCHTSIYDKSECNNCWARFYCSGGCNANNLQYAGDVLRPYTLSCEMEKKRVECALMMHAALMNERERE